MKKNSQKKSFLRTTCLFLLVSITPFFVFSGASAKDVKKSKVSIAKLKKEVRKAMKSKQGKRSRRSGRSSNKFYSVPGDYDGDGRNEPAHWNNANGVWSIHYYNNMRVKHVQFGLPGDYPFCGDVDYDGADEIMVYRPSTDACHISLYNEQWPTAGERIIHNCSRYF